MKLALPTFWKHVITVLGGALGAQALPLLEESLALARQIGDRQTELLALDSLGLTYQALEAPGGDQHLDARRQAACGRGEGEKQDAREEAELAAAPLS